jgi:hypothetical protein
MTLPTLSAEASIYRTGRYADATGRGRPTASRRNSVSPAAAIYQDGRFVCYGEVTDTGFIDCYPLGGGGEPTCRPQCGPCRRMPEEGPGRYRACVTRDCDVIFRRCAP